jgi:hypothetical protein
MQNPFSPRPLENPGLVGRLLGRAHHENAWIAVENLLATSDWNAIDASHIAAALREHGVKEADREKAKELYAQAIRSFLRDDDITDEEADGLSRLRDLLSLTDSDLADIERTIAEPMYEQQIRNVLADGKLPDDERARLERLRRGLRIHERFALEALQNSGSRLLDAKWVAAMDDRRLSDDEVKALEAMAASFGLRASFGAGRDRNVDRFRWMWLIENGTFPDIECKLSLHPGEICHWSTPAALIEKITETTGFRYDTFDTTLLKGMGYRSGTIDIRPITQTTVKELDTGTLYVTSKRVIFEGRHGNRGEVWNAITGITPYSDAVQLEREDGKTIVFRVDDGEYAAVLMSSLLAR